MIVRTVRIDGREMWIECDERTPPSEILRRAADRLYYEECKARESDPNVIAYRKAMASLTSTKGD